MKRFKKVLLALGLTGMVSLSSAFLVSCKEENEISVSFNTNGATEISDATISVGENYTLPVPTREGYRFDGWFANAELSGEPVTEIVAAANVTYYAKWTQVFAVNLDVNGGSLATTTVYLEQGANVYEAVKDLQPTKSGLTFGAWFNGNNELSKTYTMKSEALNLKAQYKVGYTVEIYLQNLEDDNYTKADTITGSEYVGKSFKSTQTQKGFTDVSDDATLTKTLSATASENVFKHYFDRNTYTVTLNPNYPGQGVGQTTSQTVKYGEKIILPSDPTEYDFEGYCLLGWSESSTAQEVEYAADLDQLLYNQSNSQAKELEYTVSRTTTLYGVWQKGYTDMFGGNDYIYYLGGDDAAVYLCRGNVYFKGELDEESGEFYFEDEDANEIIEGKLLGNGKYMYAQKKTTSVLYQSGVGVVETTKIRFDKYNELTYFVYGSDGVTVVEQSTGTFEILKSGEYVATFTSGPKKGTTLNFLLGTVTNEAGGTSSAFQVRNEDEYAIGKMMMAGVIKDAEGVYTIGSAQAYIELDGFGTAIYSTSSGSATYKYVMNDDGSILITDRNDNPVQTFAVIDIPSMKNQKGYIAYDETMKDTFKISDNETLTLDGVYNAVYVKGSQRIESYYASQVSPMGSTIVSIIDPATKTEYKFMLTPEIDYVSEEVNGEQVTTEVKTYTAKSILNTYAEYYYKDQAGIYYAPMLVIDEKQVGKASVYGYTSSKTFVKVSEGSYVKDADGLYLYTAEKFFDAPDAYSDPIDLTTIESFVFAIDTETTNYSVSYWYSSNNGSTKYYVDYENTDITSEATLKLVGGFAFYKQDASTPAVMGAYTLNGTVLKLTVKDDIYYFTVNVEDKKFTALEYEPYVAYQMNTDNTYQTNVYLDFDGLGNAVYTEKAEEGGTDLLISGTISVVISNSVEAETVFGTKIYKFTPTDSANASKAFEFIQTTVGSRTYFAVKETTFVEEKYYASANSAISGILTIDGYCTWATFVDDEENTYEGMYYVGENLIVLTSGSDVFYFDFTEDEFTVRGEEYGFYALYDNHYSNGVYVELDGYGNLSAYTFELKENSTDEYEKVAIADGQYTIDGDVYTISYGTGAQTKAYACVLNGVYFKGYDEEIYYGFTVSREVEKSVFVDTSDWSVLLLDEFGKAIKYDQQGSKQVGKYVVVTDTLLYFVSNDGSDACIYDYDTENGYATPVQLEPKSYYTQDLKSLYFDKAGFAIFNGNNDENIFYTYEGNDVVIYRRAKDGEQANAYGFVEENFGMLEKTKVYNGETYYRNYGTDIQFTRATADVKKYPIIYSETETWYLSSLQFAPSGGAEFSVGGKAKITREITKNSNTTTTESDVDCTVTRKVVDGNVEMYVTILGVYRYYITATYNGEDQANPYAVQGLSYVQSFSAYRYLDVLFRIYYMYGAATASAYGNDFGELTINIDYNEDGSEKKSSMSATIGEAAGVTDMDGNLISFEESVFQFTSSGGVAEFEAQDGYTYRLAFGVQTHQYLGAAGYFIISLARVQILEDGEFAIKVARTVATEASGITVGDVYSIAVSKNGQGVQAEEFYVKDGKLVYISRTRDADGYVTSATYYTILLTESESGSVEDEDAVATYESVTVTEQAAVILCEKDPTDPNESYKGKDRYVEIVDGEVKYLQLVGNKRYAASSSYDAATGVYTVETTDGRTYYVKVIEDGQYVVIADDLSEINS